jgi:hypothetical protein
MSTNVTLLSPVVTTQPFSAESPSEVKRRISAVLTTLDTVSDATSGETQWSVATITSKHKAKMVDFFKQKQPVQKVETSSDDFFT